MIHIADSETGEVVIHTDADEAENPAAAGSAPGLHGLVYHGVKAWIAPATRTHDWEPEEDHVFVEWVDESASLPGQTVKTIHTAERPLPGGGIARFVVTAAR